MSTINGGHQVILAAPIRLEPGWTKLWAAVTSATGSTFTDFLAIAGVAVIIFAVVTYLWGKARNRPAQGGTVMWSLIIGAVMAGPGVLIPVVLKLADLVIALVVKVLGG